MATATQRTVRLISAPVNGTPGLLRITQGRKQDDYLVRRIGSDWGDGYEVRKEDGTVYHVHLSDEGHTCDCMGNLAHGHCKHVDCLRTLRDRRLIG